MKLTENRRAIRGICDNLWVKIALENIIKLICKESGIQGGKVNNSARNSTFATDEHAGNLTTLVQQHSSHKNISSINKYSTSSINEQKTCLTYRILKRDNNRGIKRIQQRCNEVTNIYRGWTMLFKKLGTTNLIMTCLQLQQLQFTNSIAYSPVRQLLSTQQLMMGQNKPP